MINWRESVTYQRILREGREEGFADGLAEGRAEGLDQGHVQGLAHGRKMGRVEEAGIILWRLGTRRFGQPNHHIHVALNAIEDVKRLEKLCDRLLEVTAWEELLAQP